MKILYIVTVGLSAWGLLPGQLAWLRRRGHAIRIVSSPGPDLEAAVAREGVIAEPVDLVREIQLRRDLLSLIHLIRVLLRVRPDVSNVGTPKAGLVGGLASALARTPARVYTLHGLRLETATGYKRMLLLWAERLACLCAHRVVCVSYSLRERVLELRLAPPEKVLVIGKGSCNGLDVARFNLTPERLSQSHDRRAALGIPEDAPVIGFVGRFTQDKGIADLLEAFNLVRQQVPGLRLLLLGDFEDGDPVPESVRRALETDPDVVRAGFVADTAIYYPIMDVLALPTYREGFPTTPLEAAAAGKPVVTTQATGARDSVINDVTGRVVPVGDVPTFARALEDLLLDQDLAVRMGKAGRERVERDFQPEGVWHGLEALYASLLIERRQVRLWHYLTVKRAVDVTIALFALLLTAPIMLLTALLIRLEDGGPVFFAQERVGKDGVVFEALKFRSMVVGAEHKGLGLAVALNDDRITRVGQFIRAASIDELPQLWNVLMGEMSIIGPRPTVKNQVDRYSDFQRRRLEVKPGLTGWAQVNGRNSIPWEKRIELDVWYVEHGSLWLDFLILLRTPVAMLPSKESHYGPDGVTQDLSKKDE